ncbi:hypothetical protein [Streptodolium elevatio]|uniref:DUF4367 domain-containing protein n=1 Tax=Streptodolium elevatio TaxID=3157996 RepID=A0ABV3DNY4_9ACTN
MSTFDVDDLRRILAAEADENAPEMLGLVPSVLAAAPERRRNRILRITGTSVVLALLVACIPFMRDGADRTSPAPSAPTAGAIPPELQPSPGVPAAPYAAGTPVTLIASVDPGAGYVAMLDGLIGTTQVLSIRPAKPTQGDSGGVLFVYQPGTFDPAPYATGQIVTVRGRPAFFASRGKPGDPGWEAALVWQDPSGIWFLYVKPGSVPEPLRRVAEAVRITPREATVPMNFGTVPTGLRMRLARLGGGLSDVLFDVTTPQWRPSPDYSVLNSLDDLRTGFTVLVQPRAGLEHAVPTAIPPTRVGEADTWHSEDTSGNHVVTEPGQSSVVFTTDKCIGHILVRDTRQIPRGVVDAFIAGIDFRDCSDPTTWVPLRY